MNQQPKPKKNNHEPIVDLVIKDLKARKQLGKRRYGVFLQPMNGRDALQDLAEELMDGILYLKQYMIEQELYKEFEKRTLKTINKIEKKGKKK